MSKIINIFSKKQPSALSLKRRVINALVYSIGGTAGVKALQLLCGILISRILGKEAYGQYSMINSTVSLFVIFAGAGVEATLTRYVAAKKDKKETVGKIIGTLSVCITIFAVIISVIVFLSSSQISVFACGGDILAPFFKITALTIFFTVVAAAFRSTLIGFEEFRRVAKVEIVLMLIYFPIALLLTKNWGIYGSIISLLFLHLMRAGVFLRQCTKECHENGICSTIRLDREIKNIIFTFTIPAFAASLFVVPVDWILNSMLIKSFGFAELAVYSVAKQWKTMITYIPSQMNQLRPIYADLYSKGEHKKLNGLLKKATLGSVLIVLPFVILCSIFGKNILSLYGDEYVSGYLPFLIIIVTMVPYSMQMQIGSYLQAAGEMWQGLGLNIVWAIVSIISARLLIGMGLIGFAISYSLSYSLHCILSYMLIFSMKPRVNR